MKKRIMVWELSHLFNKYNEAITIVDDEVVKSWETNKPPEYNFKFIDKLRMIKDILFGKAVAISFYSDLSDSEKEDYIKNKHNQFVHDKAIHENNEYRLLEMLRVIDKINLERGYMYSDEQKENGLCKLLKFRYYSNFFMGIEFDGKIIYHTGFNKQAWYDNIRETEDMESHIRRQIDFFMKHML
jgi:hypothetical protein